MKRRVLLTRFLYGVLIALCIIITGGLIVLLESKQMVFNHISPKIETEAPIVPFPVSVDPKKQTITEEDLLNEYQFETFALESTTDGWLDKIVATLFKREWYQNLASPVSRIIVVWPGERKEEVAKNIGDVLRWNEAERNEFIQLVTKAEPTLPEGKFFPGQYVSHRYASPEEVALLIDEKFTTDVLTRYTDTVEAKVPLKDALIIASLLEREASDFENMREISGVIWNRLFIDMPLQLDATLQYAQGSKNKKGMWWPPVVPSDKFIDSPFNTYQSKGLPPAPISNPSTEAVVAALNPYPTDCLYYFHDEDANYFCSVTYEEHVEKLKARYGRGS
jgi:cell division protein YceG involved in septum cleavage